MRYISLGMRSQKRTFIDLHCFTSSFTGFLFLLPNNTASLSTRLCVTHVETKNNMCTTMFIFYFLNAAPEIVNILVNTLIIFVNILINVGSSIWEPRPFGKYLNQYLDFCIFDKLLTMLIFYPSYVIKHFLTFMITQLNWYYNI